MFEATNLRQPRKFYTTAGCDVETFRRSVSKEDICLFICKHMLNSSLEWARVIESSVNKHVTLNGLLCTCLV